jgi:GAF domain-containing protein
MNRMEHASQSIEQACAQAERLIASNAAPQEVFACLIAAAERLSGHGAVASVLVLDDAGLLRNGASPNLPADYLRAIDGLKPDAAVGTCAAAAATGIAVVTPSFLADDKWAELRHLPLAIGFAGAWSMPIKSADGRVLGTFGTYYRDVRHPSPEEVTAIGTLATTAARALERKAAS